MSKVGQIRTATVEDLDELVAMWAQYMRAHALNPAYRQLRHDALVEKRRAFVHKIEDATAAIFVIERDDRGLDGMISCFLETNELYFNPPRYVRIQTPFVRPEARLKGNLKRLLETVFEWAREWGIEEVRLFAGADNVVANAVADDLGFEAIEVVRRRPLDRTEASVTWEDTLG